MPKSIFEHIVQQQKDRRPFALATVIETRGSVSARTAAKALINDQGRLVCGWVGGGCAESTTITKALECMENGATALLDIDLDDEMLGAGMPCGGSMRVYIEAVLPAPTLWIMAPAGLDLGARTPEEIALCVMSEITLLRRGGSGLRMRDKLQREARHGE